ncbi:MAG: tripartite tricarboxylate transporter substrate binding protein [Thermodesulfobacteriota bacterium]|nr:tripartite tricarboxylate transporter substrate binding protein [Thermodesulfobacteriota bacterium]
MRRISILLLSLFVSVAFLSSLALAAYPTKPIVLVAHTTPGGGTDVLLRILAKHLEPYAGTSFVIENRPGGGGAVALNYVSTARPDGYLLLGVTPTYLQTHLLGKTARSYKDTTAVTRIFIDPMILYVRSESPYKSAKEIIEDAKKNPGKQRWGGATVGSVEHMIGYHAQKAAKIDIVPVTFEGGGDLLIAVLGGHVDLGLGEPGEVMGQVEAKKVRILANFTPGRLDQFPDVPSMKELGYDIVVEKFRGIVGPKGLPPEVLKYWEEKIQLVLKDPKYKKYYESVNLVPSFMGHKAYTEYIEKKNAELTEYLKEIGLLKKAPEEKK